MQQKKKEQLYLDRAAFMAWVDGTLLDFKNGSGVVGDHVDHERAEQVLANGGRVFLTVKGRPVSEMVETQDGYHERALEEERCTGAKMKPTSSSRTSA
jgi:hypothetical protein